MRHKEAADMFGYSEIMSRPILEMNTILESLNKKARQKMQYGLW